MRIREIKPDIITFNTLIQAVDHLQDGLKILDYMKSIPVLPNHLSYYYLIRKANTCKTPLVLLKRMVKIHNIQPDSDLLYCIARKVIDYEQSFIYLHVCQNLYILPDEKCLDVLEKYCKTDEQLKLFKEKIDELKDVIDEYRKSEAIRFQENKPSLTELKNMLLYKWPRRRSRTIVMRMLDILKRHKIPLDHKMLSLLLRRCPTIDENPLFQLLIYARACKILPVKGIMFRDINRHIDSPRFRIIDRLASDLPAEKYRKPKFISVVDRRVSISQLFESRRRPIIPNMKVKTKNTNLTIVLEVDLFNLVYQWMEANGMPTY